MTKPLLIVLAVALAAGCGGSEAQHGTGGTDASGGTGGVGGTGASGGIGGAGGAGGTDAGPDARRIFVTAAVNDGDFGGLAGADALCASEAEAAGLRGEFKAWLSTLSSAVGDRLVQSERPYVLVDGTRVAEDWADLTDGSILAPINLDAGGAARTGDVWTGTLPSGLPYEDGDCEGFTNPSSGLSLCGTTGSTAANWTANQTPSCDTRLRLFCLEQ